MAVRIMAAVWAVDLPAGEKLVLLALADSANDEGRCWPGVKSLCAKTGKSERSLQGAIKALCAGGHLSRVERSGTSPIYTVHPRSADSMQGYLPLEYHYIYRVTNEATGEFYVGARSTVERPERDAYMGSGVWVREQLDAGQTLSKQILDFYDSRDQLAEAEAIHTAEALNDALCRNRRVASPGNLRRAFTPANSAGRKTCGAQKLAETPANSAGKPMNRNTSEAKASSVRAKPKHPIPENWKPEPFSVGTKARSVTDGWPEGRLEAEAEQFMAHHGSRNNCFSDWQKAWATWALNAPKFERKTNGANANHNRTTAAAEAAFGPAHTWSDADPF